MMNRRKLIASLFVAPAIVRASSLMPVRAIVMPNPLSMISYGVMARGDILNYIAPYSGKLPAGYIPCDGRSVTISDYPELFSIFGNTFGGYDEKFNLPDFTGYPKNNIIIARNR